jgi:hypothetical protein
MGHIAQHVGYLWGMARNESTIRIITASTHFPE